MVAPFGPAAAMVVPAIAAAAAIPAGVTTAIIAPAPIAAPIAATVAAILADAAVLIGAAILTSAAIRLLIGVATIVPVLRAGTGAHAQRRDRQTGGDEYFRHFHLASSRPWIGLNRRYAWRSIAFLNRMLMFC